VVLTIIFVKVSADICPLIQVLQDFSCPHLKSNHLPNWDVEKPDESTARESIFFIGLEDIFIKASNICVSSSLPKYFDKVV